MRCLEILVVGDDPGEAAVVVEEFLQRHSAAMWTVTGDGEETLHVLFGHGYKPDLIVLDLDVAKAGQQILINIRRRLGAKVPIIAMSSSRSPEDISEAYANGANAYIAKPSGREAFIKTLQCLAQLWIEPLKQMNMDPKKQAG